MNVLFDAAPLGGGHIRPSYRAGIFRVTEELAIHLARSEECRLTLCATTHRQPTQDYLKTSAPLRGLPFCGGGYRSRIPEREAAADTAVEEASNLNRIPRRTWRKLLFTADRVLGGPVPAVEDRCMEQAQIYHSAFFGLPDVVKRFPHVHTFLTIYDLIPLLFPQFYADGPPLGFLQILDTIDDRCRILTISEASRADICRLLGIAPERVSVMSLAADAGRFYVCTDASEQARVRRQYGIPNEPYLLSLGTLEPRKNVAHVIRSFARLVQEESVGDLRLVLAGSKGWLYDSIFEELTKVPHVRDRIILTGRVADEDMAALYSGALAFVYLSLYEGFGLPPLEAMQCGTPVVCADNSSLPEVVGDGGILLDAHDEDGLCQTLLQIFRDSELRSRLSQSALARSGQFSWERCAREVLRAYHTALDAS